MTEIKRTDWKYPTGRGIPDVLKLHLELDISSLDKSQINLLKWYGCMKSSISRDVLVPGDITLHALNYLILRLFGWRNSHLHKFCLPENLFQKLTENSFYTWAKLAGIYFRYPSENYHDIYWDDDYREGQNLKLWMRKKYTGPYQYKGFLEHLILSKEQVYDLISDIPHIPVFPNGWEPDDEPEEIPLITASIDQVLDAIAFGPMFDELIERLPLTDILCVPGLRKHGLAAVRKYAEKVTLDFELNQAIDDYPHKIFRSTSKEQEYLSMFDVPAKPVANRLWYYYDYGDDWKVQITCEGAYIFSSYPWASWQDTQGNTPDVPEEDLEKVTAAYRPVCIRKDGIELVDDVGGIHGFCRLLKVLYGPHEPDEDEEDSQEYMQSWANMMGWTGKPISPEKSL